MVAWVFPRQRPMEKHRDPIQGEFFTTESIDSVADLIAQLPAKQISLWWRGFIRLSDSYMKSLMKTNGTSIATRF